MNLIETMVLAALNIVWKKKKLPTTKQIDENEKSIAKCKRKMRPQDKTYYLTKYCQSIDRI